MSLLLTQLAAPPAAPVEAVTARVQRWWPRTVDASAMYIAAPDTVSLNQNLLDQVGHLSGHDMNLIHQQAFGTTESATATYRFLHSPRAHTRAIAINILPWGATSGAPPEGTITVAGAETTTPVTVSGAVPANLGLIEQPYVRFTRPCAGFEEITYAVSTVRLHSIAVWEIPLGQLTGTMLHVDRTFADPRRVITDNTGGSNPRGYRNLLDSIQSLRSTMRRHWSFFVNPGVTVNPAGLGVWAAAWSDLRMRARAIRSTASDTQGRWRFFVYVSALGGASTWSIRLRDSTTTDTATITGITTTGWKPGSGSLATGQAFQMEDTTDTLVVEAQQTAGADTDITINGITVIEDPT